MATPSVNTVSTLLPLRELCSLKILTPQPNVYYSRNVAPLNVLSSVMYTFDLEHVKSIYRYSKSARHTAKTDKT